MAVNNPTYQGHAAQIQDIYIYKLYIFHPGRFCRPPTLENFNFSNKMKKLQALIFLSKRLCKNVDGT
jgi:hypothetical protein